MPCRAAHPGAVSAPPDPERPGLVPRAPRSRDQRAGSALKQRRRACNVLERRLNSPAAPAAIWVTNGVRGCPGLMPAAPGPGARLSHLPPLCMRTVPNFSLVFTNTRRAPVVIYSRCCLRHLPGEFDPAMFLTYFCTYLDRMLRPSKVSLY